MHPTEKNNIIIDEKVAPIVHRIFNIALSDISCRQIATQLNHIKEQSLIQKQPSNLEGCFCIYARKA